VPGSPDQMDVEFNVEEGPSAQLQGGIGYAESQGIILNGTYTDANFMGTGERIALELEHGLYFKNYSFSHTQPYTTIDGVSRTLSFGYRDATQFTTSASNLDSETISTGVTYGYPLTEFQNIQFGVNLLSSQLLTSTSSANQAIEWVKSNGDSFERRANTIIGPVDFFGTRFKAAELIAGWNYRSLNRALFPDRGTRFSLTVSSTTPGSQVQYWTVRSEATHYIPLWHRFSLLFNLEGDYGGPLGSTTGLPPYKQFFAGGPDSIRGFRESRLGPKDQNGNPYGGNLLVVGRSELVFPLPEKWQTTARASLFFDIGNVFYQGRGATFTDKGGFPVDYSFNTSNLKSSFGLAVQWLAPLGLFRFSLGMPLRHTSGNELDYGDETELFQFSIGNAF